MSWFKITAQERSQSLFEQSARNAQNGDALRVAGNFVQMGQTATCDGLDQVAHGLKKGQFGDVLSGSNRVLTGSVVQVLSVPAAGVTTLLMTRKK